MRANVLSLLGMAWNQSAVHYLSAQGLVQPASVRKLASFVTNSPHQNCCTLERRHRSRFLAATAASLILLLSAYLNSCQHSFFVLYRCCVILSLKIFSAELRHTSLQPHHSVLPMACRPAGGRHCIDSADAALPVVLHVPSAMGHGWRCIRVRCDPVPCTQMLPAS